MCRHSTSMMKFWYIRSVRNSPVGLPEQMIIPSRTDQVDGAVFTGTQPPRSLPLNNGRNPSSAAATDTADNKTAATKQTLLFLWKHMMRGECPRPSAWPSGIPPAKRHPAKGGAWRRTPKKQG